MARVKRPWPRWSSSSSRSTLPPSLKKGMTTENRVRLRVTSHGKNILGVLAQIHQLAFSLDPGTRSQGSTNAKPEMMDVPRTKRWRLTAPRRAASISTPRGTRLAITPAS